MFCEHLINGASEDSRWEGGRGQIEVRMPLLISHFENIEKAKKARVQALTAEASLKARRAKRQKFGCRIKAKGSFVFEVDCVCNSLSVLATV